MTVSKDARLPRDGGRSGGARPGRASSGPRGFGAVSDAAPAAVTRSIGWEIGPLKSRSGAPNTTRRRERRTVETLPVDRAVDSHPVDPGASVAAVLMAPSRPRAASAAPAGGAPRAPSGP